MDFGAIGDSAGAELVSFDEDEEADGALESLDEVAVVSFEEVVVALDVAGGEVKSADSTAPAVEASFELFATEEFGAMTS